jgi:hypothetical protein
MPRKPKSSAPRGRPRTSKRRLSDATKQSKRRLSDVETTRQTRRQTRLKLSHDKSSDAPTVLQSDVTTTPPKPPTQNPPQPQAPLAHTLNEEDLGIISDERSKLLAELKAMMPDTKVSPTLWACLQIGEIDMIKNLLLLVKSAPLMANWILYVNDTIKELPLLCKYIKLNFFL